MTSRRRDARDGVEVRRVGDDAVLDRLGHSCPQMLGGQCFENAHVGRDGGRRMKRAHEVLAGRRVDARLAPDRRVDHREEARGHLHVGNAAHVGRGNESREVADHAAAERDDGAVATKSGGEQLVAERGPRFTRLGPLAGRNREHDRACLAERVANALGVQRADVAVRDDRVAMRRRRLPRDVADSREQPRADRHAIRRERDLARGHQVTSPAPPRLLATRARVNSRSESRFK